MIKNLNFCYVPRIWILGKCSISVCWMTGLLPFPSFMDSWLTRFLFSPSPTLNLGDYIVYLSQYLTFKFFDIFSSSDIQLNVMSATLKYSNSLALSSSKSLSSWNIKCTYPTLWQQIPIFLPLSVLFPITSVFQYYIESLFPEPSTLF